MATEERFELPKPKTFYLGRFDTERANIDSENTYFWNHYPEILER